MKKRVFLLILFIFICCNIAQAQDAADAASQAQPLGMEECVRFAVQNSFDVKLAKIDYLIAQTDMPIVQAMFDTTLFADVSYTNDKTEQLSVFGGDHSRINRYAIGASKKFITGTKVDVALSDTRDWSNSGFVSRNPAHEAQFTLTARQPLAKNTFGYNDRRKVTITGLIIKNADLKTKDSIEELIAKAEKAYWWWVLRKDNLEIYEDMLAKAKRLHEANTVNYDYGRIEKTDFIASEANLVIRRKDVDLAKNRYKVAEENLKLVINMKADENICPQDTLQYRKLQYTLEDCIRAAFEKRRDYQEAKRDIEITNTRLQMKKNEMWPEVDVVASLAANGIESNFSGAAKDVTDEGNVKYYAGLEISMPVENNLAKGETERARHNKEKSIVEMKKIERSIVTQVGNAYRDYMTYEMTLSSFIEAARLQSEKLKEEEKNFLYGRSSTKDVIDYQNDDLRAKIEVSLAIMEYEVSRVDLRRAVNIILEQYEDLL